MNTTVCNVKFVVRAMIFAGCNNVFEIRVIVLLKCQ